VPDFSLKGPLLRGKRMAKIELTDLWQNCSACDAKGDILNSPPGVANGLGPTAAIEGRDCPVCHGSGGTPTDSGRAIVEFLRDKMKFRLEER
jgi:Tryptophan RNA-binding attenuator protein inhibitory protein